MIDYGATYAAAFADARGWSTQEIDALIAAPGGFVVTSGPAFAIGRVTLDEAELLTIACPPADQGQGHGARTLEAFEHAAHTQGAAEVFLEVAEDNAPARALYAKAGYHQVGRRAGYYLRGAAKVSALILQKKLRPPKT